MNKFSKRNEVSRNDLKPGVELTLLEKVNDIRVWIKDQGTEGHKGVLSMSFWVLEFKFIFIYSMGTLPVLLEI